MLSVLGVDQVEGKSEKGLSKIPSRNASGAHWFMEAAGDSTHYILTSEQAQVTEYIVGMFIRFKALLACDSQPQVSIDALPPVPLKHGNTFNIGGGHIPANAIVSAYFDGTSFLVYNMAGADVDYGFGGAGTNIPPIPDFSFEVAGRQVTYTNLSVDPDGDPMTYLWDFGDQTSSTQENPTRLYASTGTYQVKLIAIDPYGAQAEVIKTVNVANQPPVANFIFTVSGNTVSFTDKSVDPEGAPLTYDWDFDVYGDGGSSSAKNPTRTYPNPGTRTVRLIVTDPQGATGQVEKQVTTAAANQPPQAQFTYKLKTNGGSAFVYEVDASSSFDPDGTIVSYQWTFPSGSSPATASGKKVTVTFLDNGAATQTFKVTLKVTDDKGAIATTFKNIEVSKMTVTFPANKTLSGIGAYNGWHQISPAAQGGSGKYKYDINYLSSPTTKPPEINYLVNLVYTQPTIQVTYYDSTTDSGPKSYWESLANAPVSLPVSGMPYLFVDSPTQFLRYNDGYYGCLVRIGVTDTVTGQRIWADRWARVYLTKNATYSSGGGSCFDQHTPVLLADGSEKMICKIEVGDKLKSLSDPSMIDESQEGWENWTADALSLQETEVTVRGIEKFNTLDYYLLNSSVFVTETHKFLAWDKQESIWKWKAVSDLKPGDLLKRPEGNLMVSSCVKVVDSPERYFVNIDVEETDTYLVKVGNFFVIAHNKISEGNTQLH